MIVDKKKGQSTSPPADSKVDSSKEQEINLKSITVEEAVKVNAMSETYKALRKILEGIHVNPDDDTSPLLFHTIKLETGQLTRLKMYGAFTLYIEQSQ